MDCFWRVWNSFIGWFGLYCLVFLFFRFLIVQNDKYAIDLQCYRWIVQIPPRNLSVTPNPCTIHVSEWNELANQRQDTGVEDFPGTPVSTSICDCSLFETVRRSVKPRLRSWTPHPSHLSTLRWYTRSDTCWWQIVSGIGASSQIEWSLKNRVKGQYQKAYTQWDLERMGKGRRQLELSWHAILLLVIVHFTVQWIRIWCQNRVQWKRRIRKESFCKPENGILVLVGSRSWTIANTWESCCQRRRWKWQTLSRRREGKRWSGSFSITAVRKHRTGMPSIPFSTSLYFRDASSLMK